MVRTFLSRAFMFGNDNWVKINRQNRRCTVLFILGICLVLAFSDRAQAQIGPNLILTWNPNPVEDQVSGYFVHYATAGAAFRIDVGNTNWAVVGGLTSDTWYDFAVSAYDQLGTESLPSLPILWRNLLGTNHFP